MLMLKRRLLDDLFILEFGSWHVSIRHDYVCSLMIIGKCLSGLQSVDKSSTFHAKSRIATPNFPILAVDKNLRLKSLYILYFLNVPLGVGH